MFLFCFLDDATILHRCPLSQVHKHLHNAYPKNLPFEFGCRVERSNIQMLDIHIVPLYPLSVMGTSVYWKPMHTCSYIPSEANVPRHTHIVWVKGGFIPYVRICSSLHFYRLFCRRLIRALIYLGYPKSIIPQQSVAWCDWVGGLQMTYKIHRRVKCSLARRYIHTQHQRRLFRCFGCTTIVLCLFFRPTSSINLKGI